MVVPIIDSLALACFGQSEDRKTEKLLQRSLSIREKNLAPESLAILESLTRLADLYQSMDEYRKAEPFLQRRVAAERKSAATNSSISLEGFYQYSCLKLKMGQEKEAEQIEAEAQQILIAYEKSKQIPPSGKSLEGGVINGKAITKPTPVYPPEAKAARQTGSVKVRVLVSETGRVVRACAISGPSLLRKASEAAAYQALFTPTLLNKEPVKVSGIMTYNFILR